ncbi:MAG: hypothetical protein RLO81_00800 [Fulvivirga sp.]|uniref:hypothetical protein n=1 Tax=Fulvivirga sp. TaxID=1931237 RepID=UPI0032EC3927
MRKLEKETGEKCTSGLIAIMEIRATQFEKKLDQLRVDNDKKFSLIQRMIGGLALLIIILNFV